MNIYPKISGHKETQPKLMVITTYLEREMNAMTRGNFDEEINDSYISGIFLETCIWEG